MHLKALKLSNQERYEHVGPKSLVHKVNKNNIIANESLYAELERYKERVKLLEEKQSVDLRTREKIIMDDIIREKNAEFADFEKEINYPKQTLSEQSKEKELLTKIFNIFKNESKEKEAKNIDKEISLEKKVKELNNIVCRMGQSVQTMHMLMKPQVFYDNKLKQAMGFQNPFYLKKAQQIKPMLYDGDVIAKETNVISIADSEETLILKEESRSKICLKQSDPKVLEKKVNIKPINYAELNQLSKYFGVYKLDRVTLAPKYKNNRETQISYLKHTMEQAAILREIVEQAKSLNPLDSVSYTTYSGCSKHMTGDRSQLTNFVHKFLDTVKLGLGHNLLSVGQFCDSNLEVAFRKHKCFVRNLKEDEASNFIIKFLKMIQVRLNTPVRNIRTDNGTEFVNQTLRRYYESVGISHETSVARSPQQNGFVERDNWDRLFQPMFDEYFNPPTIAVSPVPVADVPKTVNLADSPMSTSVDQDTPSTSIPSSQEQEHSLIIYQGFEELPKAPHFHDDPLHESLHEDSTSQGSSSNVRPIYIPFESPGR
nr:retrotransposon protein, putative, Ty1-copia subclass [Tanacetum cinerariifolium]